MEITRNQYMPLRRHWHPYSETFSGGDSLLTALHEGWKIKGIFHQHHQFSGRKKSIYHILLQKNNETAVMRVICNPFVENFVAKLDCPIYLIEDTKQLPTLSQLQKIAI